MIRIAQVYLACLLVAVSAVTAEERRNLNDIERDLTVGGQVVVSPPTILAETASAVPEPATTEAGDPGGRHCGRAAAPAIVLDDASFDQPSVQAYRERLAALRGG